MTTLLHFTATWAERICGPHRAEVTQAASALGWRVREVDIDRDPDLAREYLVRNVPAVAVEGETGAVVVRATPAEDLIARLRSKG